MRHWIYGIGMWMVVVLLFACEKEAPTGEQVELKVRLGTSLATRAISDPGESPGDWEADIDSIALFLVYAEGEVVVRKFNTESLSSTEENGQVEYTVPLTVSPGTGITAYAVAYCAPQGFNDEYATAEDVQNLKSLDLDEDKNKFDQTVSSDGIHEIKTATQQEYMRNLFTGSEEGINIPLTETVRIDLDRHVAKVDVQWDVQGAYEASAGKYVDVKMSEITFYGKRSAYLFKTDDTNDGIVTTGGYVCNSAVSQRNGRGDFYTFPGSGVYFTFSLTYTQEGQADQVRNYTATFQNALEADVWYKVNLNIKGMNSEASSGNIDLPINNN